MSLGEESTTASSIPQSGFRDHAEAWKIELVAVSESAEQWKDEEELQVASLLAAKFANNLPPENLSGSEAQRQAQIAQIISQTTVAVQQANSIVQEMRNANFLGLSEESPVRKARLFTAAIQMTDPELLSIYQGASFPQKKEMLEQCSQMSPQMMRRAQQAGAANAAFSAALQSLFPAAAARYASGINREKQEQRMDEEISAQNADVGERQQQAKEKYAQDQEDSKKEEDDRQKQSEQEKSKKKSSVSGSSPSSASTATSMSKRAKGAAWKLTWGGVGALGTLGLLSELLS